MSPPSSEADSLEAETPTTEQQTSDLVEPIVDGSENYVTALEKMDDYSEMNMPADVGKGADQEKMNLKDDDLETKKNGTASLEESIDLARNRQTHRTGLPYRCYLCDASYYKRWPCLEHISEIHTSDWLVLKEKYGLTELEKFSEKMDKRVETFCKKLSAESIAEITKEDLKELNMRAIPLDYKWRKIYCCLCPLKFWSLSELQRHMCFHTGNSSLSSL